MGKLAVTVFGYVGIAIVAVCALATIGTLIAEAAD